jgi:hypothetical protein
MREKLKKLANLLDMRDTLTFGGLGLLAYGLYQVSPPAAAIVSGALLFWLGAH